MIYTANVLTLLPLFSSHLLLKRRHINLPYRLPVLSPPCEHIHARVPKRLGVLLRGDDGAAEGGGYAEEEVRCGYYRFGGVDYGTETVLDVTFTRKG